MEQRIKVVNTGIVFFSMNYCHLARLAVSLWSLRKLYNGPVCVLSGGGDEGRLDQIIADKRLSVDVLPIQMEKFPRHTGYCAKASLWRWTPYDRSLYLDADTIVVKDPTSVFDCQESLAVTRFSNWVTTGNIYSSRIKQWLKVDYPNVPEIAKECLTNTYPAVNTGVFMFDRMNPLLSEWEKITKAGAKCSFTDEYALQIMLPTISDVKWLGDSWNASPLYRHCPLEDVKIWHFHGGKNTSRPQGKEIWFPAFEEVLKENVGGIKSWFRCDKSLRKVEVAA